MGPRERCRQGQRQHLLPDKRPTPQPPAAPSRPCHLPRPASHATSNHWQPTTVAGRTVKGRYAPLRGFTPVTGTGRGGGTAPGPTGGTPADSR